MPKFDSAGRDLTRRVGITAVVRLATDTTRTYCSRTEKKGDVLNTSMHTSYMLVLHAATATPQVVPSTVERSLCQPGILDACDTPVLGTEPGASEKER